MLFVSICKYLRLKPSVDVLQMRGRKVFTGFDNEIHDLESQYVYELDIKALGGLNLYKLLVVGC